MENSKQDELITEAITLLHSLGEYMQDRADTVDDDNGKPRPNIEGSFACEIERLAEKLEMNLKTTSPYLRGTS